MRPTVVDILVLFAEHDSPLSTTEIVMHLQAKGFDIDKRYFWDHLAKPLLDHCYVTKERKQ